MMKKGVLLGFIEPVDFIHKQDRSLFMQLQLFTRLLDYRSDLFDTGQHSRKVNKMRTGRLGNNACQRCFA